MNLIPQLSIRYKKATLNTRILKDQGSPNRDGQ